MKKSRSSYVNGSRLSGVWLPPPRWKSRLYRLFGRTAPDRWVPFKDELNHTPD